jgi:ankyrin repeat protein
MRAADFGRVECMRLLLEKNADVALASMSGDAALHRASYEGHSECLRLLIGNNADVQCNDEGGHMGLTLAAPNADVNQPAPNANVNQPGQFGFTAAHLACKKGNVECLRLLIEINADVDCKNVDGYTGLMVAAHEGHPECVKVPSCSWRMVQTSTLRLSKSPITSTQLHPCMQTPTSSSIDGMGLPYRIAL